MNRSTLFLILAFAMSLTGCGNDTTINENEASDVIAEYLENHSEYETTNFTYGEVTFRSKNDQAELLKYQALEQSGLITMTLVEQKKRFLSSDSTFVYLIELTDKAAPFVLKQNNNKATVKSAMYVLDDLKPVNFVKATNNTAKATVSLKKSETEFYPFQKSSSNSEFITKTYRLRLKDEVGWQVVGE